MMDKASRKFLSGESHLPPDSWVIVEHFQSPDGARSNAALLRAAALQAGVTYE
jgi:hypothetical protein